MSASTPDQAARLREIMQGQSNRARIISVASGKGGVGKSNFSVNFAIALVQRKKRVLLLDADLGLANVDILCGLRCPFNLAHVIAGKKNLKDVIVQSPGGVSIIPGASGLHDIVNMSEESKKRLINQLTKIEGFFDFIIIDTQAGVSSNVMNFISAADETLIVTTPEPTALADAYALIKMVAGTKAHAQLALLVNMVNSEAEGISIADKLRGVTHRFLNFEVAHRGTLPRDEAVPLAVRKRQPFSLLSPQAPASKAVHHIANYYAAIGDVAHPTGRSIKGFFSHLLRRTGGK